MSMIQHEASISPEALLQQVSQLEGPALDKFLDQALLLRAERRAPRLPKRELKLFEVINFQLPREEQTRFDLLVTRRRANKITLEEITELEAMTDQSEMQAAKRIQAVSELAQLRGLTFDEMWKQIGL